METGDSEETVLQSDVDSCSKTCNENVEESISKSTEMNIEIASTINNDTVTTSISDMDNPNLDNMANCDSQTTTPVVDKAQPCFKMVSEENPSSILTENEDHSHPEDNTDTNKSTPVSEIAQVKTFEKDVEKNTNDKNSAPEKNEIVFCSQTKKCEACSYETTDKILIDLHACKGRIGQSSSTQTEITITYDGNLFICGECGYSSQGHGFEEHLMCHILLKPYQCIYCFQFFMNRKEIGKHVAVSHKGKRMNCALKAMRKAKAIMVETKKIGNFSFFAKVSGKVPVGISSKTDQSKKMNTNSDSSLKLTESCPSTSTVTSSDTITTEIKENSHQSDVNMESSPIGLESKSQTIESTSSVKYNNSVSSDINESTAEQDSSLSHNEGKTATENTSSVSCNNPVSSDIADSTANKDTSLPPNEDKTPTIENASSVNCNSPNSSDIADSTAEEGTTLPPNEEKATESTNSDCNNPVSSCITDSTEKEGTSLPPNKEKATENTSSDRNNPDIVDSTAEEDTSLLPNEENTTATENTSHVNCINPVSSDITDSTLEEEDTSLLLNKEKITATEEQTQNSEQNDPGSVNLMDWETNKTVQNKEFDEPLGTTSTEPSSVTDFESTTHVGQDDMPLKIVASFSLTECHKSDTSLNPPFETSPNPVDKDNTNRQLESHSDKPNDLNESNSSNAPNQQTELSSNQQIEQPSADPPIQLTVQEILSSINKQNKNPNFYACGYQCDFSCLNSLEFREHLQLEHFQSTTYPCCHCGWTTHSEDGLLKHVTNHAHAYNKSAPLYFCGVLRCRFGTNLLPDFINHQNILHPDLTQYSCKECGVQFQTIVQLLQHFEDNYLHVVTCPHCTSKGQIRQVIIKHISEVHPGKPKMVSIGKKLICKDRKINSFHQLKGLISNMRRSRNSQTNLEHLLNLEVPPLFNSRTETGDNNISSVHTSHIADQTESSAPASENEDNEEVNVVKKERFEDNASPTSSAGLPDMGKQADNLQCNLCTFVARDTVRLHGHQSCHMNASGGDGRVHAKKQRFKCPYCPQCFENMAKFSSHVSCHPGLNKYTLYVCKHCEFNSNQKHNILKHIENKCGRNYLGVSEDLYTEEDKHIESRVLECENCSYQTRHKIHLKIHYESEHKLSYEQVCGKSLSSKNDTYTELNVDELSTFRSPRTSSARESIMKKFMCPVCFYLLPKGADLKKHIRKHPELGKVSLVLFRCRYCSCASTAKHVIAGHIKDKHPGRDVALVKKIISVDTRDTDNSFSETQVSEVPVSIPESEVAMMLGDSTPADLSSVSKIIEKAVESNETFHHVFIVPEYSKGNFSSPVNCPCCEFLSYAASPFISHIKTEHPNVCIVGKQTKPVSKYYKLGTTVPYGLLTLLHSAVGLKQEAIVLSYNDVFGVSAQCPKCTFSTYFKQNLALHVRDHHKELSILESQKEALKAPANLPASDLPPLPVVPVPTVSSLQPAQSKAAETLAKIQELRKQDPIIVGSGILDDKLKGLYENLGFVSKCAICGTERPKRYHMHVHVLRHLNVSLWKCQYCDYKGLERYKMCKHIKDQHPQKKMAIKYLPVDIEEVITEYLNERSAAAAQGVELVGPKVSPGAKYSMDAAFSPLGNDDIDQHLKELYREDGEIFYCILCSFTVRRKFAVHRHLVSSHLAIALVGCGYCGFRGIDRKSVIDHSHEQHSQSTLNVILLPNDLQKIVSDCLSSSGLKEEQSDIDMPMEEVTVKFQEEKPKMKQKARKSFPTPKPASVKLPSNSASNSSSTDNFKKYVMGTELLDAKLRVLFSAKSGVFKCNVCENEFPRKYAIHRHLLMSHLKIGLMQCPLCSFSGVERYLVMNHLKEHHKVEDQIPYPCPVDMDAKISEFLSQELSQNKIVSNRRKSKEPKKSNQSFIESASPVAVNHPMVVALFNKRKLTSSENEDSEPTLKKIKQEVVDEQTGSQDETNDSPGESNDSPAKGLQEDEDGYDGVKPEENWEAENGKSTHQPRSMFDVGTKIQVINLSNGYTKRFGCEKCSFTSAHRSNVQRHVFRVHEKFRYKICNICGYRTLSNVLIRQHIQEKHRDATDDDILHEKLHSDKHTDVSKASQSNPSSVQQGLYACAYCNFETNTSEDIVKHMDQDHPKSTEDDEYSSAKPAKPNKSKKTAPVLKVPSYQAKQPESSKKTNLTCEYCDFQCSIYRLLKSHVALVHKDEPRAEESLMPKPSWKYACVECHLKMDAGTKMKCHIGRHFNYKPYVCETCFADFASPDEMRKHIRRYLHSEKINYVKDDEQEARLEILLKESKQYALDILDGKVPNLNPNRVGQRIVRKKTQVMTVNEMEAANLPLKKPKSSKCTSEIPAKRIYVNGGFGCSLCDFQSQSINDVSTHHVRTHRNKTFLWKDLVMGYVCDINGRVVESDKVISKKKAATFKTSYASKIPCYTCSKCGFNTAHLQGIVGHVKAHGTRDYLCAYCSNRYFKRAMLNRHQRSAHKGKRLWIINQSTEDISIAQPSTEDTDADEQVSGDTDEQFSEKNNLKYCCHLCPFKADSLYQYRSHLPSHGQCGNLVPDITAESPLKCGYCAYVAVDQRDFSAHITIHFYDRTYKCYFCEYSSYQRKDVQYHLHSKHSREEITDETKYIVSSKDLQSSTVSKTSLPMLANLDPRVVLEDTSNCNTQPSLTSILDVSGAFEILELEMGAVTDSEITEDQLLAPTVEEIDNSSVTNSDLLETNSLSEISENSLLCIESNVAESPSDACSNNVTLDESSLHESQDEQESVKDPPSDFEVFDSIDKAIEQLNSSKDDKVEESIT